MALKANWVLACIKSIRYSCLYKRSFIGLNAFVLSQLHKSLVQPILEYKNAIWGPHYVSDQHKLEGVLQN